MLTLNILANEKRREALCYFVCPRSHAEGLQGEKLTFCNYGGELRELRFEVCECSVYVDGRVAKPAKVAGFIKPGETVRPKITVIKIA